MDLLSEDDGIQLDSASEAYSPQECGVQVPMLRRRGLCNVQLTDPESQRASEQVC